MSTGFFRVRDDGERLKAIGEAAAYGNPSILETPGLWDLGIEKSQKRQINPINNKWPL